MIMLHSETDLLPFILNKYAESDYTYDQSFITCIAQVK
jgi:hypothetical protein